MVDPALSRKWAYWTLFLVLAGLMFFMRLIPLQTTPSNWAMPDLLVCMCFAWVLRRPDYTPVLLIAAVMLLADMLFQRPPGLMAALVVIGTEFLRRRTNLMRELPFLFEWAMVAGVMVAMLIAYRLVLIVVMQPRPSFWLSMTLLISTIAAYPLVVAFSRYVLGVRKIAPGEVDELGHRI
jgi:rod shape-determining protein MreD